MKVIIDGVEYIPAKQANANTLQIAKGLLQGFWGTCSDNKANEFINDPDIMVYVNDDGKGITLSECLDNIADEADKHNNRRIDNERMLHDKATDGAKR